MNVTYRGRGKQSRRVSRTVSIDLPPGVDNGVAFTVEGEGAEGDSAKAPKGDLLIQVSQLVTNAID